MSEDRGLYGRPWNKKIEPKKYNPLGIKQAAIPDEAVCAMCGSTADFTFPIQNVLLCPEHTNDIAERQDVEHTVMPYNGVGFCAKCGKQIFGGFVVSTHICNKCTRLLGEREKIYRVRSHARKVV